MMNFVLVYGSMLCRSKHIISHTITRVAENRLLMQRVLLGRQACCIYLKPSKAIASAWIHRCYI